LIDFFAHYADGTARIELLRSFDKDGSFERRPIIVDETVGPGTITPSAKSPSENEVSRFMHLRAPERGAEWW
jgi:hypothetical protein